MANTKECDSNDLQIAVKAKRTPRFKAGAELSKSVNLIDVEYNEEVTDTYEMLEVKLLLRSEDCVHEGSDC